MVLVHPFEGGISTRSPPTFEDPWRSSLLRRVRLQVRAGCMWIVDGFIVDRELGCLDSPLPLGERRERPVEDPAGEERPLDWIARTTRVNHALDRLQQVGEVGV